MRLKTTLFLFIGFLYFSQVEAQSCSGADFEERNGIAVIELDSKVSGSWRKESVSGSSGGKALTYRGSNKFNSPGSSVITYKLKINTAGTYRFAWRSKISIITTGPHPANTEHNDSWLKIQAADFYGQRGSSRVYPGGSGKSPVAAGATSGGWFKVFTNVVNWSWVAKTNDGGGHNIYARFSSPGVYNVQISGRSQGHTVDRMILYKESSYSASQAQSLSRSVTTCSGGTTPPPSENVAPTVSITSPSNGQTFDAGSNITVNLSASDSDGSIQKHEIFVNNSKVDTDGSSYSAYTISNAAAGSYSIKATVTDNGGKTASSTVNISVGGSTPPPPPPSENVAPTVSITSPSNGQSVNAGSNVSIGLSANDSDGSIVKHEIFVNGTKVDTDGTFYTPHIIRNISAGSYAIKATVTDNGGETASSTINITAGGDTTPPPPPSGNVAPTVSFTNLSNGDQVNAGSTVSVGVSASDSDGSVVKYQVFVNGLLVDTDGSNYTPHPIRNIASGAHTIKVTVTDNQGATGSSTVNITAGSGTTPPPPPTGSDITFDLINAATNTSIGALVDGATISSSKTQGVNIRVNAPANSKRVGIELYRNGTAVKVGFESFAPYAVFGDRAGNYFAENLASGSYTLIAAGYSSTNNINDVIARSTIKFTVGSASGKSAFLFPNPVQTDGKVSVRLPEGTSGQFKYSVTNSLGVQVEQGAFDASSSQRDVQLSLPNIGRQVQGVYYMTLSSNGSKETIPLIRE